MLEVILLTVAGTLVGNEICIALFIHPIFYKLEDGCHLRAVQPIAQLLGRVMPFWYFVTLALALADCYLSRNAAPQVLRYLEFSTALFALSIVFTVVALVPINNKIARFSPDAPPANWLALRKRWDRLHVVRVLVILLALIFLALAVVTRSQ
jgi:hypothetical protein